MKYDNIDLDKDGMKSFLHPLFFNPNMIEKCFIVKSVVSINVILIFSNKKDIKLRMDRKYEKKDFNYHYSGWIFDTV